ncbi:hypothetical protein BGX23_008905 [Mortierella sp. AD031]|nr:hypothetical protein BGX23_008905 [Mortierella sp. AD031]
MVWLSLLGLILSASVATLAAYAQPAPPSTSSPPPPHSPHRLDPCGTLGSTASANMTVDLVGACYRAIPFNRKAAATTLQSVYTVFNDYYTFRDSALAPTLPPPFTSAPVDILKKLEAIGRTRYTSDHQFHSDVQLALYSLYDAHAAYNVDCYAAYLFEQSLSLYAPVIDGTQSLLVFKDEANRGYEDCTVVTIDGQEALPYINSWATKYAYFSKDAGVRQNQALATQRYDHDSGSFETLVGEFAQRADLPERGYIDYGLQCGASTAVIHVRDNWKVIPRFATTFNDIASYTNNVCLPAPASTVSSARSSSQGPVGMYRPHAPRIKRDPTEVKGAIDAPPAAPVPSFQGATRIGVAGNGTVFYQLTAQPHVGVMVVYTHSVDSQSGELDLISKNFAAFHEHGVTDILIDFQGNYGGYIYFASALVQKFFPNKNGPLDAALPSNMRVTKSAQQLSHLGYNTTWGDNFNAQWFYDYTDKDFYANDDLYMNPVTSIRNGRAANYTEITSYYPHTIAEEPELATYPWTNNPAHIRILTDGRCGSSCALSSYMLKHNNVTSYSVGGHPGQPLSGFSFPGGAVSNLAELVATYTASKMLSPVKNLSYKGFLGFTAVEVFAHGSQVPLDFDAEASVAAHRLDYTTENARHRDVMWTQVAAAAWK